MKRKFQAVARWSVLGAVAVLGGALAQAQAPYGSYGQVPYGNWANRGWVNPPATYGYGGGYYVGGDRDGYGARRDCDRDRYGWERREWERRAWRDRERREEWREEHREHHRDYDRRW